jgi:hypothetical protein
MDAAFVVHGVRDILFFECSLSEVKPLGLEIAPAKFAKKKVDVRHRADQIRNRAAPEPIAYV